MFPSFDPQTSSLAGPAPARPVAGHAAGSALRIAAAELGPGAPESDPPSAALAPDARALGSEAGLAEAGRLEAEFLARAGSEAALGGVFDPQQRLVVAMSGGVDSSVVAWLLHRTGQPLVGLFMRNGVKLPADETQAAKKSCCSVNDARDARMVAAALGIPFQAVDLSQEFASVIRHFLAEYQRGRTPNPCAICNRDLKFDRLLTSARELGAVGVATGHYARLDRSAGRVRVRRGLDRHKDQSYQLFAVSEQNLACTRLPLGDFTKPEVRLLAARAGLRTAAKKDSQEICFVPGNDYRRLLDEAGVERHPGRIVDSSGKTLREHAGIEDFTVGQRRGHGVGGTGEPLYVVELEPETGTVVLGGRDELCASGLRTGALNWIGVDPPAGRELRARVQIRYHHQAAAATVEWDANGAQVHFDEPQLAVAPGQGAALYIEDRLIGGGWIERAERGPGTRPGGA
jgi:tRNA-specific 2-thiouridylase